MTNLVAALGVLEGVFDGLEVANFAGGSVTTVFKNDLGLAPRHDAQHVGAKALGHVSRHAKVAIVLADHGIGRGAVQPRHSLVAQQKVATLVLEHDDVRDFVEHGLKQAQFALIVHGGSWCKG
jgi:hypothetical protein